MSAYMETIREILVREGYVGLDAEGVEAWMRVGHPTLGHLTPTAFAAEVGIAAACEVVQPWSKELL